MKNSVIRSLQFLLCLSYVNSNLKQVDELIRCNSSVNDLII
jgi:hypothetical protein